NLMIQKVSNDFDEMKYNTAIAAMMAYVNVLYKQDKISKRYIKPLLILLNPVAPHVTEELWERLELEGYVFEAQWPVFDASKIQTDTIELPVQVNGKIRFKVIVDATLAEDEIKKIIMEDERLIPCIQGKEIQRIIIIKGKIVNIVA
ncbi:MAG: class I tRNA ligase family protein, partial [Anaerovoracaceae bacterium]